MRQLRLTFAVLSCLTIFLGTLAFAQEKPVPFTFIATLTGDNVASPVETTGSGTVIAVLVGNDLTVTGVYRDLQSPLRRPGVFSGVNISVAPPGKEAQLLEMLTAEQSVRGNPLAMWFSTTGGTSGTFSGVFTLSDEQVQALWYGLFYVQLYTVRNRDGELRGQLTSDQQGLVLPWRVRWQSSTSVTSPVVHMALTPVASGLEDPVGIYHLGDGSDRLIIVEQTGTVRVVEDGEVLDTPFLDISDKVGCCDELGLLSFAAHPEYPSNGIFFVSYTGQEGQNVIERYRVSDDPNLAQPESGVVILEVEQPGPSHNGGHIAFGLDGYLYIGIGDGDFIEDEEFDENPLVNLVSQDLGVRLGKLLRIDVDGDPYRVPPDNPFASEGGVANEVWAWGLRNPWRFSFDRLTGDLFIGDVGQITTEEVDVIPAGEGGLNFGWPYLEGSRCTIEGCDASGFIAPIFEYGHGFGCAITGGYIYRGLEMPELQGVYLYGDFCYGEIWTVEQTESGWQEVMLFDTDMYITSFGEDEAGELYVTDHAGGVVYRLVRIR